MRAAILAAVVLTGCGVVQTVTPEPEQKRVTVQMMGAGDWWGNAVVFTDEGVTSAMKPGSDTSALDLGTLEIGSRFTFRTGVGRAEYFKTPDSVIIIMGRDTLIRYMPEALEAVYIVE